MEHNALGNTSQSYSATQGVDRQKPVNFASDPAGDNLSGIEIQDGADIIELSPNFYISKVADPYQIGGFRSNF